MTDALFTLGTDRQRDAVISLCGRYRYRLTRQWANGPTATFIMLNPSTADALTDDPTIRRCLAYARAWDCGSLTVVNLYAWRATDPRQLWTVEDPVGPDNDSHLVEAAQAAGRTGAPLVAAWGANAKTDRIAQVLSLTGMGALTALDVTTTGQPKHPLYLRADLTPKPWRQP